MPKLNTDLIFYLMKVIAILFVLILQIGITKIKAQYHVQRNRNPSGCTVPCNLDVDGDGISGCFDKCPNTPPGATVDSHGCPLDTDGDGVPDYKDKQLITPTECQPTDSLGIGECEYHCNANNYRHICGSNFGKTTIYFASNSIHLDSASKKNLNKYAKDMQSNPNFKVVIKGFCASNTKCNAKAQQLAWDHVFSVIKYLSDVEGIDKERFIFLYGEPLNNNLVELNNPDNSMEGPDYLEPPFPKLSLHKL